MKHITLFLAIFVFYTAYTQDPQLFENDWYLQNVIIDGQDNFPPSNDDVPFITIAFIQNNSFISTYVCDALEGTVIYTNSEFLVNGWSMTLGGCFGPFAQENTLFQGIYLDTFFVGNVFWVRADRQTLELTSHPDPVPLLEREPKSHSV